MPDTGVSVFDISKGVRRPGVRVHGTFYGIVSPGDLSPGQVKRMLALHQNAVRLADTKDHEARVALAGILVERVADPIMVRVPDEARSRMTVWQRLDVAFRFLALLKRSATASRSPGRDRAAGVSTETGPDDA